MAKEKKILTGLTRDLPETPEGKYLILRRDGTVPKWRSFVLGACDPDAAETLRFYADQKEKRGEHAGFVAALRRWADEMDAERLDKGESDPQMGPHRVDCEAVIALMKLGMSA